MMKNVLYISPAFSEMHVAYKHNLLFLEAINNSCNIHLVTGKRKYNLPVNYIPVFTTEMPFDLLNSVVNRIFPNRVFYGSDPFKRPRVPFLKKVCEQHIENNKIDIIHTQCRPYFTHKIGYELKKKYGLPWIAQFLDAWLDNPDRTIPKRLQKRDSEMEAIVANHADIILHTNRQLIDIWDERYGDAVKGKMYVMPFCYNKSQIENNKSITFPIETTKEKIQFSYIGISVGNRNLQDIIEASHRVLIEKPHYRGKFQINIIGNFLPVDSLLINKYGLSDVIIHRGYLRGDELQKAYNNTDIFIAIDSPAKVNVFFPSKLLDYFYHQKPILGITSKHGVTNDLLNEAGHVTIENGDIESLVAYICSAVENYVNLMHFNRDFYLSFSPEKVNTLYSRIVQNL